MKILLDTTYFLPLIGFTYENVDNDFLLNLMENDYQLLYSPITIFELQAKGAKAAIKDIISAQRVINGIQSLINDTSIIEVPFSSSALITQISIDLRHFHNDFIDCLILSTAILSSDILISEHSWIIKFVLSNNWNIIISKYQLNVNFNVKCSEDFYM